jgi:hypothetical protein
MHFNELALSTTTPDISDVIRIPDGISMALRTDGSDHPSGLGPSEARQRVRSAWFMGQPAAQVVAGQVVKVRSFFRVPHKDKVLVRTTPLGGSGY